MEPITASPVGAPAPAPTPTSPSPEPTQPVTAPAQPQNAQVPANTGQPAPTEPNPGAPAAANPQGEQGAGTERKSRYQERINEITAARRDAERRSEAAEARAKELEQQLKPPGPEASQEAIDDYRLKKVVREERIDQLRQEGKDAEVEVARRVTEALRTKAEAVADRMPGLFEKVAALPKVSRETAVFMAESEKGAEIAHHLVSNPGEATRIADLSPVQQGIELARLEARLSAVPQARKVSTAPAPVPTVTGNVSPAGKTPAEMSVADIQAVLYPKTK